MIEVKVIAASVGALVVGVGLALSNGLIAKSELLGSLPPWLQFVAITALPPFAAWLGGFSKKSATSNVSDGYIPPSVGVRNSLDR